MYVNLQMTSIIAFFHIKQQYDFACIFNKCNVPIYLLFSLCNQKYDAF